MDSVGLLGLGRCELVDDRGDIERGRPDRIKLREVKARSSDPPFAGDELVAQVDGAKGYGLDHTLGAN